MELEFDTSEWIAVKMDAEKRAVISNALEGYISAGILFPEETRLVEDILKKVRNHKNSEVAVPLIILADDVVSVIQ